MSEAAQQSEISRDEKYQVMPDLEPEAYRALKEDIDSNGQIVPISVDEDGNIIDGYHRKRACDELEIEPIVKTHEGLSEDEKVSLAWRLNMQRRHVDQKTKKELVKERLNQLIDRDVKKTDDKIADEMGSSQSWVQEIRKTVVNEKLQTDGAKKNGGGNFSTISDYATSEQKSQFIKDVLVENPDKSNRAIAEQIGVSNPTVGKHRKELPTIHRPQLVNDDATDVLADMADESVDLVVTDPPYGISFDGQRYDTAEQDELAGDSDTELIASVVDELYRVLKPDSHCYVFCRWDVLPVVLEAYGDPFEVDTTIVWDKCEGGHGMGDLTDWAPRHELIVKCSKGDRPINGDRKPNVIRQQDARFTDDDKQHPTQKPRELIETLIEASSDDGDVVFDPFGGVHTTAAAAVNTGRECLSVELDVDHHSVGRDRVAELVESERTSRTMVLDTEVVE